MPGYTPEKKRPEKVKPGSEMYIWVMEKVAIESSELLDPEKAEGEEDRKMRNSMNRPRWSSLPSQLDHVRENISIEDFLKTSNTSL